MAGRPRNRPFVVGQSDTLDAPAHPAQSPWHRSTWASGKARHKPDQIATIVQPNLGNFVRTLAMPKTAPLGDFPAGRGRGVSADVRRYPDAPHRPGCGRHPRHHDGGRGQTRQPTVQLRLCGGHNYNFQHYEAASDIVSDGQQNTPAALGIPPQRTTVRTTNLANIAAYVVARIAPTELSGRASGEFQTKPMMS
jgi:hypothetical protein